MLYLIAVFLGISIGLLSGGRLSRLLEVRVEKLWIVIAAFALQIILKILSDRPDGRGACAILRMSVLILSYILLFSWFWYNRRFAGIWVVSAGSMMNTAVIMANAGYMPVNYDVAIKAGLGNYLQANGALLDGRHILMSSTTKLPFLGDMLHPPSFLALFMQVVSPGDIAIGIGLAVLFFEFIKREIKLVNNFSKRVG